MAFTKIVSPGIDTTGSYTVQELSTVGVMTAGTVQVGAATTVHTTGIDLGSGNITSHNINSTGIITATSFVGPVTGNITGDITATSGTFSGNVSIGGTLTYEDVTNIDSVGVITARSGIHVTGGSVGISTNSITANASADDLQIGSRTDGTERGITIASSVAGSLRFADDGNDTAGWMYYSHSDNSLRLGANGSERLRINSSGSVGIGTDNPNSAAGLDVLNGEICARGIRSNAHKPISGVWLGKAPGGGNAIVEIVGDTGSTAEIDFTTPNTDTKGRVAYDLTNNYMYFYTNGANERLRITSDGKIGISDTSPENTLSIKNIGSFEGDANSFYLGSNFTGTGQNFSGSGKHAQRFFFNNASSNGYLRYENTGTTGNAGDAITWQERFRIRADGTIRIGGDYYTNTAIQMSLKSSTSGCQIQMHDTGTGTGAGDGLRVGYNGSGGQMWLFESGYIRFATSNVERLRIEANGTTTVGPQYDQVKIEPGNGTYDGEATTLSVDGRTNDGNRVALKVDRYASGTSATTKFSVKYDGSIFSTSGMQAASVNLQSSSTASWFQTGANYGGADYVWAAKNTQTNTWHSGLKTTGDLYLGGNITGTPNIRLNGSNGSCLFTGTLEADPVQLDANDSWIKSTYGGISNSTVSSLNNLMIGQNMRGWIGTRDGGSATNNFYHIVTHGGLGYCGTEYCYEGITKFYNNTGGSTANATFTPKERVRLTSSRFYSSSGFHFSTNSSSNNSLPNPYAIGNVNSNNVAYPHTPGIYFVTASCQCDNTWRTLFTSINDSNWVIEGTSGDASSKRKYKIIGNPTSPSYGVNLMNVDYNDGGWNTGSISFRLDGTHPNWNLQVKCTSYYSTSNTSGIKFMLYVIY